jgi:hypothetical protein
MAGYYTVQQGDYLSRIAKQNGFPDYTVIWNDPNNAKLKQTRQNPNVLYPGDQVYIPNKLQRQESRGTEKRHAFVVNQEPLKLRLVLEDIYEKPIANAPCALLVGGTVTQQTTDGQGRFEQEIPQDAHEATLVIQGDETPFGGVPFPVKIGTLDPVDKVSGQIARLNNLGYFAGNLDESQGGSGSNVNPSDSSNNSGQNRNTTGTEQQAESAQFLSAVEEFQCDHGLTVDGKCGPLTQAKLKQVHGC